MKSTSIPNGFIFRGAKGEPLLLDFDDNGNVVGPPTELAKRPDAQGKTGKDIYRASGVDVVTFVHTVKGEVQMLIKDLFVVKLLEATGKKPLVIHKAFRDGKLSGMAKEIRQNYIKEIEKGERHE